MSSFTELIEQGELLQLLMVAGLLYFVGQMAVGSNGRAKVWGHKLALLTLIAFCGFQLFERGISDAGSLFAIVIRGSIAAVMMLGLSWILLSALTYFNGPTTRIKHSLANSKAEIERRKQRREEEARQEQERLEWERSAPQREQEQRQLELTKQRRIDEQHQREEIRLNCQLLYDRHASELKERFPRTRLVEYMEQYLNDERPLDVVAKRAELLTTMIASSLKQTETKQQKFASLNDIAAYFQQQKQEIESLGYDESTKQTFLCSLNDQEDRTIREFLST